MSLLPDAEAFKRLVDGTDRGPGPTLARLVLAGLSVPYGLAVRGRNLAYDHGLLPAARPPVPVISVGNLTLGGTGKTPLVAWLARTVAAHGLDPAIVSRGYGAARGERSDEAAELAILLPKVPHVADRDRVAGVRTAAAAGANVALLDDGFQHRRLARDLDIVAVDATDPWGGGRLFPRGLLREPLAGLTRAQAVVLTRATAVEPKRRTEIRRRLERACGATRPRVWVEANHRPVRLRSATSTTQPLERLATGRIAAFAGIGNPAAFRTSLANLDAGLIGFRAFPDHHAYTAGDLDTLRDWAAELRADLLVTTLKDLVKVRAERLGDIPLVALEIALEILPGGDSAAALEDLLAPVVARAVRRPDRTHQQEVPGRPVETK
ncbi:MAG: tetraacyldisaccharide 4'-kinase [Planctomycetia bacterium]